MTKINEFVEKQKKMLKVAKELHGSAFIGNQSTQVTPTLIAYKLLLKIISRQAKALEEISSTLVFTVDTKTSKEAISDIEKLIVGNKPKEFDTRITKSGLAQEFQDGKWRTLEHRD